MDPYLEHPGLWPDLNNSFIGAIRDALANLVAPRYYIALEKRTYILKPDDIVLIGRPDIAMVSHAEPKGTRAQTLVSTSVLEVEVPMNDEVGEMFLQLRETSTKKIVTILELLSPVNKLHREGRRKYERKRDQVFSTRTNLVEVDLMRAGEPMPVVGKKVRSDYRILVSRGSDRPRARLHTFSLRDRIPTFPLPLLPGDEGPLVDLGAILHALYDRARFDLQVDYTQPPAPPLDDEDTPWARGLIEAARSRAP